ncbi:MAG TPA: hypothetical protein VEY12_09955 [Thermoplasmata archaeon]|nr:hypothetical protein [Thermoplasmata archaeon]
MKTDPVLFIIDIIVALAIDGALYVALSPLATQSAAAFGAIRLPPHLGNQHAVTERETPLKRLCRSLGMETRLESWGSW